MQRPLLSRHRGVSGAFIIPLSQLLPLLLGSLSFFSLFYFKVAFYNKRTKETKKNAFGWFRWR